MTAVSPDLGEDRSRWRAFGALASRLGCTEGQAMTLVIGVGLTVAVTALGIPPAMRDRLVTPVAQAPPRAVVDTSPEPSVVPPAPDEAPRPVVPPPAPTPRRDERPAMPVSTTTTLPPSPAGPVSVFAKVGRPGAPDGVSVAPDGTVYVATNNATGRGGSGPSKILAFSPGGSPVGSFEIEGQPDDREDGLTGLAVDADGQLVALDASTGRVLRVDPATGEQSTVATLFDLPRCAQLVAQFVCEPGEEDGAPRPRGVAVGSDGTLYVTDAGQATIWRIADGGVLAQPWHSSADYRDGAELGGVQLDGEGALVFAAGSVYRLPVSAGLPGERTELTAATTGKGAAGLAIGPGGEVYVALAGADEVIELTPDGAVARRFASGREAPVPLDSPVGVALGGGGLLVTNQSTDADDPSHWVVLRIRTDVGA